MEEELEKAIAELVEAGLLIEHWDENLEEYVYEVTIRARDEAPELWEMHIKDLHKGLHRAWLDDFVEIDFTDHLSTDKIMLTEKCFDEDALNELNERDRKYIHMLVRAFDDNRYGD